MIHCQNCKRLNAPEAKKCSKCGANLLPGISIGARFGIALACFIGGPLLGLFLSRLIVPGKPPTDLIEAMMGIGALILSYGLSIGTILFGIYWLFRITPTMERYQQRGIRHMKLDPKQAIADFSTVLELYSKKRKETANLNIRETWIMRGEMYKEIGLFSEASNDFNSALNEIDRNIDKLKKGDTEGEKVWKQEQAKVLRLLAGLPRAKEASVAEPPVPGSKRKQKEKA